MNDSPDARKRAAARAALEFVAEDAVIGVGTGTTTESFIDTLVESGVHPRACVASSERTRELLVGAGFEVLELNEVGSVSVYVDGADLVDRELRLIKGGGGALTREKIVASSADLFVCIVDESKLTERFDDAVVPVEVIPMARVVVTRWIARLGGHAVAREGFVTDNGNGILDVTGLDLRDPESAEASLSAIAGVVECGLFARRGAGVVLVGTTGGVERFESLRTRSAEELL